MAVAYSNTVGIGICRAANPSRISGISGIRSSGNSGGNIPRITTIAYGNVARRADDRTANSSGIGGISGTGGRRSSNNGNISDVITIAY
jgi:hypothetical protein